MSSSDASPLTNLVYEIDRIPKPQAPNAYCIMPPRLWRARIYRAAADETEWKYRINVPYDPSGDARVQYLLEWADILEGTRRRFSHGIEATMRFLFMPCEDFLSGKDLAAGETRTLAQGS